MSTKLALFSSGSGTNVENIIHVLKNEKNIFFPLILSNKADAFVLERAKKMEIPAFVFSKKEFDEGKNVLNLLRKHEIDGIVLAGFLLKISEPILQAYPNRIINIHPALLPKYGGKGMYGDRVHEAVKAAGETESGITIHYVNSEYDSGDIIFQAKCPILPSNTPHDIATNVHQLEYKYFPQIIKEIFGK